MNYELKDTNWINAPKVKDGDPTKVTVDVVVTTGVVGDIYGFVKQDLTSMEFDISLTGTQMQSETTAQAAAFSAAKYPNT